MKRYPLPLELQTLALQEIAHRTGWHQGGREHLQWAIVVLKENNHRDAADFLEGLAFGEATQGIKQASRFQPGQHKESSQAPEVKAPDTTVQWPGQKP